MSNQSPKQSDIPPETPQSEAGKASAKFLLAPVIIAVAILAGLIVAQELKNQPLEFKNATLYPKDFRPVPNFVLEDQNGQAFSNNNLKGKWSILFFGFTHCPDVCPTTLNILQQAYSRLGNLQKDVQVILVSVDPERDTQQQRKDYIEYFNPDFIALGGTSEDILSLTKSMYIHYQKNVEQDDPENYLVDHSAAILVISPEGRRHAQITPPILPGAIAQDLTTMIEAY